MAHISPSIINSRVRELLKVLQNRYLHPEDQVVMTVRFAHSTDPVPWDKREALTYKPIHEGETWGETWESAWFHAQAQIPAAWAGAPIVAQIDLGGETLVFDDAGCPRAGLTSGSVFDADYNKDLLHLPGAAKGG